MKLTLDEAVHLLQHASSPQRRRGAKTLRDLGDPTAAPAIRSALEREVLKERTWETQYQMVLALGETGTSEDIERLKFFAAQPRDQSMVNMALAYAIITLGEDAQARESSVVWCLEQRLIPKTEAMRRIYEINGALAWKALIDEGALAAVVDLQLALSNDLVHRLIDLADLDLQNEAKVHEQRGIYILMASACWSGESVRDFQSKHQVAPRANIAKVAARSAKGEPSQSFIRDL